jgi:Calcineurin-like phosphoesterase
MSSNFRPVRTLPEQHEMWLKHLRGSVISRRTMLKGAVGGMAGTFLLGSGSDLVGRTASASALADTGTVAGGFVVNGRHLSYGNDPTTQMWTAGQLFNIRTYNAVPPSGIQVWVDYGRDATYGATVVAEIKELLTHVPVWDGKPGVLKASRTLNADQFFVHALLTGLDAGTEYHYRFRYAVGGQTGTTTDATFSTAPSTLEPFTFTAFGDQGIPGPSLDRAPSLLPNSDWEEWNDGTYSKSDPDRPSKTGVATTVAVISEINKVRNLTNGTPSRFNLLAGDLCYAQAEGDIQPIINPDGPNGKQPSSKNFPRPAANSGGWDYYDPWVWTSWFPMIEPSSASIPWMFTTGNHEPEIFSTSVAADAVTVANYAPIGYGGLVKRVDLPTNGPSACPSVYSFSYGNVGIVSVDANDLSWEIQGLYGYSDGAQLAWLKTQLAAFRADPTIDFIVAFYHECAFSTCNGHGSDGGVRSVLGPLFSQYQVDLAVQGHNHVYERTNPIVYDAATNSGRSSKQAVATSPSDPAEVSPATDGTTYAVVGTAGTPRYGWNGKGETDRNFAVGKGSGSTIDIKGKVGTYVSEQDFSERLESVDWSQSRYSDYGFIALDVVPAAVGSTTTMTLRFINEQGRELDRVVFSRTAGDVIALPPSEPTTTAPTAATA